MSNLVWVLAILASGPLQAQGSPVEEAKPIDETLPQEEESSDPPPPTQGEPADEAQAEVADEEAFPEQLPELEEAEPFKWSIRTLGGLLSGRETFTGLDGNAKVRFGVGVHVDATTASETDKLVDNFGRVDSGVDLRRLRVKSHGLIYDMNFALAVEFANHVSLKDAWVDSDKGGLSIWGRDLGRFRIGHQKEPFGFERQTSGDFLGFLERSLPVATFSPDHSFGAALHGVTDSLRQHWSLGVFSVGSSGQDQDSDSAFSITGRWTGLPIYKDEGKSLLHVGVSFSDRNPASTTRYYSRPEARHVDPYAETPEIDASGVQLFGAELAGVKGSFWAQAEWISTKLEAPQVGNPSFEGQYVQVGWFITGQTRPYRRTGGVFDSFRPELAYQGTGLGSQIRGGAYELVGRFSRVDLNDERITGGKLVDWSLGINWYARVDTKISVNYIFAKPEDKGESHIALLRLQYAPW